jgi:hypothetical protein
MFISQSNLHPQSQIWRKSAEGGQGRSHNPQSTHLHHHHRHIVMLLESFCKGVNIFADAVNDFVRGLMTMLAERFDKALFAELIAFIIHRF